MLEAKRDMLTPAAANYLKNEVIFKTLNRRILYLNSYFPEFVKNSIQNPKEKFYDSLFYVPDSIGKISILSREYMEFLEYKVTHHMNKEYQEFHNYYPPNRKKLHAAKEILGGKSKDIYIKNLISNNQDLSTTSEND